MSYENVKLWFAKDRSGKFVTIDEVTDTKGNTYSCPMCGSSLIPKAVKSRQVSSHFAHVDTSKCNAETMIHWWFKNKFLEQGDSFEVVSDKERQYICKEVLVEQSYRAADQTYRPDVTVITECGNTIFFEMDYSNKKKVQDYIDIWLELRNVVVEVDVKKLMMKDKVPSFKALFYNGKCFNTKKNDLYYNTIGKFKERMYSSMVTQEIKERIRNLDWFWSDVLRYKKGLVDIDHIAALIDNICGEERYVVDSILNKSMCSQLHNEYVEYKTQDDVRLFDEIIEKDSILRKATKLLNKKFRSIDKKYEIKLCKETEYYYEDHWFRGRKRKVSHVSHYTYSICVFHDLCHDGCGRFALKSVDITNRIFDSNATDFVTGYVEKLLMNHNLVIQCNDCNNKFTIGFGEVSFYNQKGLSIPRRCKTCREKRKLNKNN